MLRGVERSSDPRALVGHETHDDAAVYQLSADQAVVETVDFFTPVVDDPWTFGRIAGANAFSDIWAMGARPLFALNLVGFPVGKLPLEVLTAILQGGADAAREAGAPILGGHSIDDPEPKYGMAVTGLVHPDRILRNVGARPGDALLLTKPLGAGIVTTAIKRGTAPPALAERAIRVMAALNKVAGELLAGSGAVHALTDVTGFGLLGHLHEMLAGSRCAAEVTVAAVPVFDRALEYSADRVRPGRTAEVIEYVSAFTSWSADADEKVWMGVLCDPQTSGGLLMAVPGERASELLEALVGRGVAPAVIGTVVDGAAGAIAVV